MDRNVYLKRIDEEVASGNFSDDWDSLSGFRVPDWYKDAKFYFYPLGRLRRTGFRQ